MSSGASRGPFASGALYNLGGDSVRVAFERHYVLQAAKGGEDLVLDLADLDGNTRSLGREALEWYVQARYLHVDALLPGGDLSGVHVVACDACPEEAIAVAIFERCGKTVFPALSERPHRVAAEGRELPKRIAFQVNPGHPRWRGVSLGVDLLGVAVNSGRGREEEEEEGEESRQRPPPEYDDCK